MYIFRKISDPSNRYDAVNVKFTIQSGVDLHTLLEEFGYFLRGCGFSFKGEVGVVDNDLPSLDTTADSYSI